MEADPTLPFEMWKLQELVQMDGKSWVYHRDWLLKAWAEGLGVSAEDGHENGNSDEATL